jgi:hypothetical protein
VDWLRAIGLLMPLLVAVAAIALASRDRGHVPFAFAAAWVSLSDWARMGLSAMRVGAQRPYIGVERLALHGEQFVILSLNFVLVALVLRYFTRIKPAWTLVPFALALGVCLDYPAVRGESLVLLYRSATILECVIVWTVIGWAMLFNEVLKPNTTHLVLMFWAAADVIIAAVPFAHDFFRDWDMVRIANLVTALSCIAAQLSAIFSSPARAEEATR